MVDVKYVISIGQTVDDRHCAIWRTSQHSNQLSAACGVLGNWYGVCLVEKSQLLAGKSRHANVHNHHAYIYTKTWQIHNRSIALYL